MLTGRCRDMATLAVALLLFAACQSEADAPPRLVGSVVLHGDRLSVTQDGVHVCLVGGGRRAARPSRHCLRADLANGSPVVAAALEPLDAAADVVMVLTGATIVVGGLGPGAVRVMIPPASAGAARVLALWLDRSSPPQRLVCASYVEAGRDVATLVVHRTLAVGDRERGRAEVVADACH